MSQDSRTGVALINVGTPDAPTPAALRKYLRQFLGDPRVLDMPAIARWLLLELVILPRRPRASAQAYAKIWTPEGSPLAVHTDALARELEAQLGGAPVEVGMGAGSPSIEHALSTLRARGARRIVCVPLFPQNAEATTGSVRAELARCLRPEDDAHIVPWFYDDPGFLRAWHATAAATLRDFGPDHVLLSYHGLPERQLQKSDASGTRCLVRPDCCDLADSASSGCYRAQCCATTRGLIDTLGLDPERVSTSFQSRLGRAVWMRPYTDDKLRELAAAGVRKLAVLCPSFVADCLETLEEIGMRGAEQWREHGGKEFELVACPNSRPEMADALAGLVARALPLS